MHFIVMVVLGQKINCFSPKSVFALKLDIPDIGNPFVWSILENSVGVTVIVWAFTIDNAKAEIFNS